MKVCPKCGFAENPLWKPLFWKMYWEYIPLDDFMNECKGWAEPKRSNPRFYCEAGDFYYDFEDSHYYYKCAGKTRKMIHRFPKGFESMGNAKLYEKTPSEQGMFMATHTAWGY